MSVISHTPSVNPPAEGTVSRDRTPVWLAILTVITVLGLVASAYFGFVYAGQDARQGDVQRIFYIHMASFFGAFVAFAATVVGGIGYLVRRHPRWDALALAGVEVGLLLALINLVTGMIWARPIWNTWWTWDPRLVSDAIMCLTYAAYLMLRQGIDNPDTRRRFASIYGIFAFTTVIITLIIIRIRPDTIHPAVIGSSPQNAEGGFGLTSSMITALIVNLIVWGALIPAALIAWRIRLEALVARVDALRARVVGEG
jgi:heme exporter protein C